MKDVLFKYFLFQLDFIEVSAICILCNKGFQKNLRTLFIVLSFVPVTNEIRTLPLTRGIRRNMKMVLPPVIII